MPLELDITSNIEAVERGAGDFFRSQVPFAASLAINKSMMDVRRVIVEVSWPKAFEVRNKAFPRTAMRIKFSRKTDLEAVLYDRLGREYLERHANSGIKSPRSSKLSVPVDDRFRTATGRIAKNSKPGAIIGKKGVFEIKVKSKGKLRGMVLQRQEGQSKPELLYYQLSHANIRKSFRFYEDAPDTFERVMPGHWNASIARALATSNVFD